MLSWYTHARPLTMVFTGQFSAYFRYPQATSPAPRRGCCLSIVLCPLSPVYSHRLVPFADRVLSTTAPGVCFVFIADHPISHCWQNIRAALRTCVLRTCALHSSIDRFPGTGYYIDVWIADSVVCFGRKDWGRVMFVSLSFTTSLLLMTVWPKTISYGNPFWGKHRFVSCSPPTIAFLIVTMPGVIVLLVYFSAIWFLYFTHLDARVLSFLLLGTDLFSLLANVLQYFLFK